MIKFLRRVFCLREQTSKGDARFIQQTGNFEIPVQFQAQGPWKEEIRAHHQSGNSRIIICDERKLTFDCVAFERCNDVYWFQGTFEDRYVTIKRKPKTKRLEVTNEVHLLAKIDHHENVMRYCFHTEDIDNCYIVTDYGIGLLQYIDEHRSIKPKIIFQQLCDAVSFIHGMNILLLNINPKNVRVKEVNSLMRIKLTNFESSFQLDHKKPVLDGAEVYSCDEFAAPEIKEGARFSSDIYSLGCLFYFVLTMGKVLYFPPSKSHNERLQKLENSYSSNSEIISFVDIIRDMVKFDCNERPDLNEIISHPCFWNEHDFFELIMDVCRALENKFERKKIRKNIDQNRDYQKKVLGKNWKSKIHLDNSKLEYSGSGISICDLVKFIRNNYAHRSDAELGKTKAELMTDWVNKFPYLMIYLYKVKYLFNTK